MGVRYPHKSCLAQVLLKILRHPRYLSSCIVEHLRHHWRPKALERLVRESFSPPRNVQYDDSLECSTRGLKANPVAWRFLRRGVYIHLLVSEHAVKSTLKLVYKRMHQASVHCRCAKHNEDHRRIGKPRYSELECWVVCSLAKHAWRRRCRKGAGQRGGAACVFTAGCLAAHVLHCATSARRHEGRAPKQCAVFSRTSSKSWSAGWVGFYFGRLRTLEFHSYNRFPRAPRTRTLLYPCWLHVFLVVCSRACD